MNCQQVNDYLLDYCENNLPDNLLEQIREHLKNCPLCRNNEKWTRMENQILRRPIEIPSLSPTFNSQIMHSISARNEFSATAGMVKHRFKHSVLYITFAAVAVAVVVLLAVAVPHDLNQRDIALNEIQKKSGNYEKVSVSKPTSQMSNKNNEQKISSPQNIVNNKAKVYSKSVPSNNQGTNETKSITPETHLTDQAAESNQMISKEPELSTLPLVQGIPAVYSLINSKIDENQIIYYYIAEADNTIDRINFNITITQSNFKSTSPKTLNTLETRMVTAGSGKNIRNLEYKGEMFIVKIEGNLSDQQADQILGSIKLTGTQ